MKKNKGFTLIEMLLTITLLLIIIGIVYQMFTRQLNSSKESAYTRQINTIKQIARDYHLQNLNATSVYISDLNERGLINSEELVDPRDGSLISGCIRIEYNNIYNQYDYIYESNLEMCN